ncbi:MAG: UPF0175 family protein [Candidatus Micrarchaeota archaeon]|nr:UPF0175 family protein [Candidatus Micrarchaeota archaeon]
MAGEFVGFRAPQQLTKTVAWLAKLEGKDKSQEYREVFEAGLREKRRELALSKYLAGGTSVEKAAEIAGVSVWEMLDVLEEKVVSINFDFEGFVAALAREKEK